MLRVIPYKNVMLYSSYAKDVYSDVKTTLNYKDCLLFNTNKNIVQTIALTISKQIVDFQASLIYLLNL